MIENDLDFVEQRRKFYENEYRVSEPIDAWHDYAQKIVHSTTRHWFVSKNKGRPQQILNAGSGGSDYGIALPMVHLDLIFARIAQFQRAIVGDISKIPAPDASFDGILCVGSVLNYANPCLAIHEFQRILRPGGFLVLEYERSGSAEYRMIRRRSSECIRVKSFYGAKATSLWVYGDKFIDGLLALNRLKVIKEFRFHGLSSAMLALTGQPRFSARWICGDRYLANLWPIRNLASNRMLAVEKLAD